MSRKTFLLGIVVLLLFACVSTAAVLLVRHVPEFYSKTAVPPGIERTTGSKEFQSDFWAFYNSVRYDKEWRQQFTEEQINSYFDEDFVKNGLAKTMLPEGITEPRVSIQQDKIRLAFRYGTGSWSTVVSIDARVWLTAKEPNVVALELQSLHAGLLPISAQSLLERIYESAQQSHVDVNYYRYNGNPVALLRFQTDQRSPSIQLQRLELHPGSIVIAGRSIDPVPLRAMLPAPLINAETN